MVSYFEMYCTCLKVKRTDYQILVVVKVASPVNVSVLYNSDVQQFKRC